MPQSMYCSVRQMKDEKYPPALNSTTTAPNENITGDTALKLSRNHSTIGGITSPSKDESTVKVSKHKSIASQTTESNSTTAQTTNPSTTSAKMTSSTTRIISTATKHLKCGGPPVLKHGAVSSTITQAVYYKCFRGYVKTVKTMVARCRRGKWTAITGKCRAKDHPCGSPPVVKHAVLSTESKQKAYYRCTRGYVKTGILVAKCRGGKWTPPRGKCIVEFKKSVTIGRISDGRLPDASGLAASHTHPGYLYCHNDFRSRPELFLISTERVKIVAVYTVVGARNVDWEDIAVGPCEFGKTKGDHCVYIGDFGGHNDYKYFKPANVIYKVKEPKYKRNMRIRIMSKLHFRWHGRDADTLLVTPSGHLYAATSNKDQGGGVLYFFPSYLWRRHDTVEPKRQHHLHVDGHSIRGGDISPDGAVAVIKTSNHLYYWELEGENVGGEIDKTGRRLSTPDMYGQGVAFNLDSSGVYVIQESDNILYFFERRGMK